MSDWEQAGRPTRRRSLVIVAVVGLLAVGAAVAFGSDPTDEPGINLTVDDDPTAPTRPSDEPIAWTPVEPGRWREMPDGPLTPRVAHFMLWTGRSVLVWGGFDVAGLPLINGGQFNPEEGTWTRLPPFDGSDGAPAVAAWTGADALVVSSQATHAFDPADDRWITRAAPPLPQGHAIDRIVGTGDGAVLLTRPADAGATWRPALLATQGRGRWRRLPDPPVRFTDNDLLVADADRASLVTGSIRSGRPTAVTIGLRDEAAQWSRLPPPPGFAETPPVRLLGGQAAGRLVVVGLDVLGGRAIVFDDGAWRAVDPPPAAVSTEALGLWTDDELLIWDYRTGDSGLLDPAAGSWTRLPRFPFGGGGFQPAAWTGTDIVTWGGFDPTGGVYAVR